MTDATIAANSPSTSLHRPALLGILGTIALFAIFGAWAGNTVIGGAIIATGQTSVQGKPFAVQSLDGGIVRSVDVKSGDKVEAGQVLIRLDPTVVSANLEIARTRLAAALALRARLMSEQAGHDEIVFAYPSLPIADLETGLHEDSQRGIFAARANVMAGERTGLQDTIAQIDSQISGIEGQREATLAQVALLKPQLENQDRLMSQGLIRQGEVLQNRREMMRLDGQLSSLDSEAARLRTARRDAENRQLQTERQFLQDVVTELNEVADRVEELTLEVVNRSAELKRADISAPASGVVHEMQITGLGNVVAPGATLLEIIPTSKEIEFEVKVDPRSVDQIYIGQQAELALSSYDPRSTPRLDAKVSGVSPDAVSDPRTGRSFFRVILTLDDAEDLSGHGVEIRPGMPIEAYLQTGDRSVLSYLLHPISQQLDRAFRE